jgi:hypothetical protein
VSPARATLYARERSRAGAIRRAAVLVLAAAAVGCGKVGPPLPPLPRTVARPGAVSATQLGDVVRLAWQAPNLDLRESEPGSVARADVYRLTQPRDEPAVGFIDRFEEGAEIIGFLDYETLTRQLRDGQDRVLAFEQKLDLSRPAELANTRFVFAVRYTDRGGRPQAWSNLVTIEPVPGIALPPTRLAYTEAQDSLTVTWDPPARNFDGTEPAQVIGYNVYRAAPSAGRLGAPVNRRPLTEPRFEDRSFVYLNPYVYVVRSISQGPDAQVESSNSEPLRVTPRDVFRPAAPTNVTAASAGGFVSLFWPANAERDLAGYFVYRTEGEPTESSRWNRLGDQPITRTTFRDERTRTGQRYGYRVTAVDRYGNESLPSVPVAENAAL